MKLEKNSKLLMIGDSITDLGRGRPVGESAFERLGQGYVALIDALLGAAYPAHGIRVVNMGTSGNTVLDLAARWQTDVLELKPDWLSVMIGANDVWRQFDAPRQPELHVLPDQYEHALDTLMVSTLPAIKNIVLLTPFYVEPNRADAMRARMDEYGRIVKRVADKHSVLFVDTQAAFDAMLNCCYPASLALDRVHPNQIGHMVLARAFLNAIDYVWCPELKQQDF